MSDKIAVFIDGGYIAKLTRDIFKEKDGSPFKIDFGKLSEILATKCNSVLFRTYYYDCSPYQSSNPTIEERKRKESFDKFEYALRKLDKFEIRLGNLKKCFDEKGNPDFEQKGVDVRLAIDVLKLSLKGKIDAIILVSGDSDFVPVVNAIKDEGIQVYLFYHESSIHRNLLDSCDEKKLLDDSIIKGSKRD